MVQIMASTTASITESIANTKLATDGSLEMTAISNMTALTTNVCGSDNVSMWMMTSPVCSTRYGSIITFVLVALLLAIITFITIFGNLLVLLALYRFKKLRSMSNCLIGNLAVSDLLLALSVLPVSTTYDLLGYWVFGEIMCTIWLCIDVLYCTASIWGLCTIAVDRYTATVYPVWYHERKSPTRALVYIIFVWMFSIIVSVAPFIGWRDMIPNFYQINTAINKQDCVLFMSKSYVVYSAMGSFVIPTCLMVFLYVRIFIVLKKRTRSMQPMQKRTFYPSESDFDSEAHALEEQDSDDRTDVELRAASTQTTPLNNKKIPRSENGHSKSRTMNGYSDCNKVHSDSNRNKPDILKHDKSEMRYKRTSLTIEVTDLTTDTTSLNCLSTALTPTKLTNNDFESENKQKNCNLTVNYDQDKKIIVKAMKTTPKSPSHVSRSINFSDESHDTEYEVKYCRAQRTSKAIFFPWKRGNSGSISVKHKYELRERRATKRMAMIMAIFCFCWWPFLFMYTIRSFCESCLLDVHLTATIIWLGYANSSLNPILYTIFNEDFRKAFQKIVFCKSNPTRRRRP